MDTPRAPPPAATGASASGCFSAPAPRASSRPSSPTARDPVSGALPAHFRYRGAHNTFSLAAFAQQALQLSGPAVVISCACSSSAKVFASGRRAIEAGLIDAALVGGGGSPCPPTLYCFYSPPLVARPPCRPLAAPRG